MITQARTNAAITPQRLQNFSRLMQEKLDTGDIQAKKAYLHSVISNRSRSRQDQNNWRKGLPGNSDCR